MLKTFATLGTGLMTALAVPAALAAPAHADCAPTYPTSTHAGYQAPVPVYTPPPVYVPAPPRAHVPARADASRDALLLRRADYNRDGGVTLGEAHAYARSQFARADLDRNGVLSRHEIRNDLTGFARQARGRGGVVTFDEYDASMRDGFRDVDHNRDGYLSSYELGTQPWTPASQPGVSFSWHWQL